MDKIKRTMAAAHAAPRCLARNRAGNPCQRPASKGRKRCQMHGGAKGSGAQPGNQNRLKHGHWSAGAVLHRQAVRVLLKQARDLVG